jgi:branched-chain amino acid aminotransferase
LNPFNSTLHYAVQCYEGLKAYKNAQGKVRLFRTDANAKRFKTSSQRVSLPDFDGNEFIKLVEKFVMI